MIESSDAMVSVLGFTGILGVGWSVASYAVPYEGRFAGFQRWSDVSLRYIVCQLQRVLLRAAA